MFCTASSPNLKTPVITFVNEHTISHYLQTSVLSLNRTLSTECCSERSINLVFRSHCYVASIFYSLHMFFYTNNFLFFKLHRCYVTGCIKSTWYCEWQSALCIRLEPEPPMVAGHRHFTQAGTPTVSFAGKILSRQTCYLLRVHIWHGCCMFTLRCRILRRLLAVYCSMVSVIVIK